MFCCSRSILLKESYTFNKIERLRLGQRLNLNGAMRAKAKQSWKGVDAIEGEYIYPVGFLLLTEIHTDESIPDSDAFAWLGKRFLDGAVDAGIVPEDHPRYISEVTMLGPIHAHLPGVFKAKHTGIFVPVQHDAKMWAKFLEGVK